MTMKNMTDNQQSDFISLAGHLLIAMPNIDDDRFDKAVIYVSAHTEDTGAMGIVINRPADKIRFFTLLDQMNIPHTQASFEPDVLIGGPAQVTRGFILHSDDYNADTVLSCHNHIALTTSERILLDVAAGQGPRHLMLALGCATWISGQLEEELMSNVWLTAPANTDIVFHTPYAHRWEKALNSIGVQPPFLSAEFGKA